jgi:hypothetical protein
MSISRNIISFIIVLSVFCVSFAPGPGYTEPGVNPAPEAKTKIVMVEFIVVNKTHDAVRVVLYGTSNRGNSMSYNFTAGTGQTRYDIEAGKYTGLFKGCNGLDGGKVFDLKSKGKKTITLTCPSKNRPPSKIVIK